MVIIVVIVVIISITEFPHVRQFHEPGFDICLRMFVEVLRRIAKIYRDCHLDAVISGFGP